MVSRQVLLTELEEEQKRKPRKTVEVLSMELLDPEEASGYDPYDHPGASKPPRDVDEIVARRREPQKKKRRR